MTGLDSTGRVPSWRVSIEWFLDVIERQRGEIARLHERVEELEA